MPEKIDQKTEMNQGDECISLIERNVLYKTADSVFHPPEMEAGRATSSPKKRFWVKNDSGLVSKSPRNHFKIGFKCKYTQWDSRLDGLDM